MINRRNFVFGAAALAATPLVPRLIQSAVADDQSLLWWDCDMEVSSYDAYMAGGPGISALIPSGNTPIISTEQSRSGSRSLKCLLNRHTSGNPMRTETSTSPRRLEFFKTYWIGLSIYIPSNWVESRTHLVLFNFHHEPKNWSTYPGGFSPVLGIRINGRDNRFRLVNKYVQTDESVHQSSDVKTAFDVILPGSIQPGKWYDWVLEYHADWRNYSDGGRGITRVWRDGKMVVDYKGPNCVNGANMGYPKFGVYKSAWQDRNYDDWVVESVFYFDEFRISKADVGSYELVAPGASSGIIKPPRTPEPVNVS